MGRVLWRISEFKDLSGIGGTVVSGRWHHKGRPIVYLADCPATALLEILVNLEIDLDELPETFTLLRVELHSDASERDARDVLPVEWNNHLAVTRQFGDDWLRKADTLLLQVPTAIVPHNSNFLFNPLHPDAGHVELTHFEFPVDPRLFRSAR
ncbi:RES domain-containing protein [Halomonas sp. ZH2S]|uniref:RES domain-containing protein n=1 Tax=Vreelandella zhuhanensis TaxID=2684210 RepID=A0A7X3KQI4_9GAMM|nr:RES family NAD+ phosphorylase [Halomonas zhuhanensis]MWJ28515.1 RES domain-containing protein [Halomonas zhuhanensis]